jgi:hypothetical protein
MSSPGFPSVPGFNAYMDGAYTHFDGLSTNLITRPYNIDFAGTIVAGEIVGFDYGFTYQGTRYNFQFHHTNAPGDTHQSIVADIANQFKTNATINAAIGDDIVSYALARQTSPTTWAFQFFQNVGLVTTGNIAIAPYSSANMVVSIGAGGPALECNPYIALGRSTYGLGRLPQSGDNIAALVVGGDVSNRALDLRNCDPMYWQLQWHILDPTAGVASAEMTMIGDTLNLDIKHLLINGAPAGPLGVQGPPGGNIAGSIVQSPFQALYADANQTGNCFSFTKVYKLGGMGIAGWTTIATLTPSNCVGSWCMNKMKCELVTGTHGCGSGTLECQAYFEINNGPPVGNFFGPIWSQGPAAQFKYVPGPNNSLLVQVASGDGVNYIASGFAKIEYFLSDAEGVPVTWTIL